MAAESGSLVFVGNLPSNIRIKEVQQPFQRIGKIKDIYMRNGNMFVQYESAEEASRAVRMLDGNTMAGRRSRVEISKLGFSRTRHDSEPQRRRLSGRKIAPHKRKAKSRTRPVPLMDKHIRRPSRVTESDYPPQLMSLDNSMFDDKPPKLYDASATNLPPVIGRCYSPRSGRELPPIKLMPPSPERALEKEQRRAERQLGRQRSPFTERACFNTLTSRYSPPRDRHGNVIEDLPGSGRRFTPPRRRTSRNMPPRLLSPRRPKVIGRGKPKRKWKRGGKQFPRRLQSPIRRRRIVDSRVSSRSNRPLSPRQPARRRLPSSHRRSLSPRRRNFTPPRGPRSPSPEEDIGTTDYSYDEQSYSGSERSEHSSRSDYSSGEENELMEEYSDGEDEELSRKRSLSNDSRYNDERPESPPRRMPSPPREHRHRSRRGMSPVRGPRTPPRTPPLSPDYNGPKTPPMPHSPSRSYSPSRNGRESANSKSRKRKEHDRSPKRHGGERQESYRQSKGYSRSMTPLDKISPSQRNFTPDRRVHTGSRHYTQSPRHSTSNLRRKRSRPSPSRHLSSPNRSQAHKTSTDRSDSRNVRQRRC